MNTAVVRLGWLRFMYVYTIIGGGGGGLAILFAPGFVREISGRAAQSSLLLGLAGSVFLAFGVASIFALRCPLKFAPVLVLQLFYKAIWLVGVFVPQMIRGQSPTYVIIGAVVFLTYIIGDLIAIPFSVVFAKESET